MDVLVYQVAGIMYGLPLPVVRETILAVEVTPLTDASGMIIGVVNVRGEVMPVADMRKAVGLQPREMLLSDRLIIVQAGDQPSALLVDAVSEVVEVREDQLVDPPCSVSDAGYIRGVLKREEGLVFVLDIEQMLEPRQAGEAKITRLAA